MFYVKKMDVNDFPFAVKLANTMNWNLTTDDFKFTLKLEPGGSFVLYHDRIRSGIVTSINFEKIGWLGTLIVKEDVRGEGAGRLLVRKTVEYLTRKGATTIGLFAYPNLVKFYESFGFKSDVDFLVFKGEIAWHSTQEISKITKEEDISKLKDLDCNCFGANREKLLDLIFLNKNNLQYVSTNNNYVVGYVAAKVYDKTAEIGPLVCCTNCVEEAVLLFKTVLSRLNGFRVFTYIPKKQTELINVINQAGLKEDVSVVRMFLGPVIHGDCIYAAESLERG